MKNLTSIIEGFFNNVNVSKDVEILKFIQDLQKFIDIWKSSSNKTFTYGILSQYADRSCKGDFDFDICIEAPSSLPDKNSTSFICSFWKDRYDWNTPGYCRCWTVNLIARNEVDDYDANEPTYNLFDMGEMINKYIHNYNSGGGKKKSIRFKVRVCHNGKYTKWI